MKNEKDLGHVKNIECHLIKPLKMEFNMDSVKQITLMVGQNGSGKTMINKIIYFSSLSIFFNVNYNKGLAEHYSSFVELVQYTFDNVFTSPEELEGSITVFYENGTFNCSFVDGIITNASTSLDQNVTIAPYPKYMSTVTRLFSSMEAILAMQKALGEEAILKHYKIYDMLHCDNIKRFAMDRSDLPEDLIKTLKESYDIDIIRLTFSEATGKFSYTDSNKNTRLVSTLGAGHQSMINMMVGTAY